MDRYILLVLGAQTSSGISEADVTVGQEPNPDFTQTGGFCLFLLQCPAAVLLAEALVCPHISPWSGGSSQTEQPLLGLKDNDIMEEELKHSSLSLSLLFFKRF